MASSAMHEHANDLRAACDRFDRQEMSLSSVEQLVQSVRDTADRMAPANVTRLVPRDNQQHSRKAEKR